MKRLGQRSLASQAQAGNDHAKVEYLKLGFDTHILHFRLTVYPNVLHKQPGKEQRLIPYDIHRGKFIIFQIKYNETILFFKKNSVILTYINESTIGLRHI